MATPAQTLLDRTQPVTARVAAAEQAPAGDMELWRAACAVLADGDDEVRVRRAAVLAVERHPADAPAHLVRVFAGDPQRILRGDADAALRRIGAAEQHPRVFDARPITRAAVMERVSAWGHDARLVAALERGLVDSDDTVRAACVRGLGMLGELGGAMAAVRDVSAAVRACAAETLGDRSTLRDAEIRALGQGLQDGDPAVREAARKALRKLGIQPMAAPPTRKRD